MRLVGITIKAASRLPDNPAVRFDLINGTPKLILSPLEQLDEPASLVALRERVIEL
jgi:hypothetical protein